MLNRSPIIDYLPEEAQRVVPLDVDRIESWANRGPKRARAVEWTVVARELVHLASGRPPGLSKIALV